VSRRGRSEQGYPSVPVLGGAWQSCEQMVAQGGQLGIETLQDWVRMRVRMRMRVMVQGGCGCGSGRLAGGEPLSLARPHAGTATGIGTGTAMGIVIAMGTATATGTAGLPLHGGCGVWGQ
jgi:hypothetical protein